MFVLQFHSAHVWLKMCILLFQQTYLLNKMVMSWWAFFLPIWYHNLLLIICIFLYMPFSIMAVPASLMAVVLRRTASTLIHVFVTIYVLFYPLDIIYISLFFWLFIINYILFNICLSLFLYLLNITALIVHINQANNGNYRLLH